MKFALSHAMKAYTGNRGYITTLSYSLGYIFLINVYMVLFLFYNVNYVFLLLRLCILIVCLCMATLTEVFFRAFSSVVRQMPG